MDEGGPDPKAQRSTLLRRIVHGMQESAVVGITLFMSFAMIIRLLPKAFLELWNSRFSLFEDFLSFANLLPKTEEEIYAFVVQWKRTTLQILRNIAISRGNLNHSNFANATEQSVQAYNAKRANRKSLPTISDERNCRNLSRPEPSTKKEECQHLKTPELSSVDSFQYFSNSERSGSQYSSSEQNFSAEIKNQLTCNVQGRGQPHSSSEPSNTEEHSQPTLSSEGSDQFFSSSEDSSNQPPISDEKCQYFSCTEVNVQPLCSYRTEQYGQSTSSSESSFPYFTSSEGSGNQSPSSEGNSQPLSGLELSLAEGSGHNISSLEGSGIQSSISERNYQLISSSKPSCAKGNGQPLSSLEPSSAEEDCHPLPSSEPSSVEGEGQHLCSTEPSSSEFNCRFLLFSRTEEKGQPACNVQGRKDQLHSNSEPSSEEEYVQPTSSSEVTGQYSSSSEDSRNQSPISDEKFPYFSCTEGSSQPTSSSEDSRNQSPISEGKGISGSSDGSGQYFSSSEGDFRPRASLEEDLRDSYYDSSDSKGYSRDKTIQLKDGETSFLSECLAGQKPAISEDVIPGKSYDDAADDIHSTSDFQ